MIQLRRTLKRNAGYIWNQVSQNVRGDTYLTRGAGHLL